MIADEIAVGAATVAVLDAAGHPDGETILAHELDVLVDWCGDDPERWIGVTTCLVHLAGVAAWGVAGRVDSAYPRTAIAATVLAIAADRAPSTDNNDRSGRRRSRWRRWRRRLTRPRSAIRTRDLLRPGGCETRLGSND